MRKRLVVLGLVMATLATVVTASPREASAQMMGDPGRITALPQATVGVGLLGAELVMMIESGVGLRNKWAILGSGALGLIAGCIGGYFIDQAIDSNPGNRNLPMISTATLVVGLGLIIPTAILFVSATMYHPEDTHNETDDNASSNAPLEESVGAGGSSSAPAGSESGASPAPAAGGGGGGRSGRHPHRARPAMPEALLNFSPGRVRLGVPNVTVGSNYSLQEMRQYGLASQTEWRVPVLSASF